MKKEGIKNIVDILGLKYRIDYDAITIKTLRYGHSMIMSDQDQNQYQIYQSVAHNKLTWHLLRIMLNIIKLVLIACQREHISTMRRRKIVALLSQNSSTRNLFCCIKHSFYGLFLTFTMGSK